MSKLIPQRDIPCPIILFCSDFVMYMIDRTSFADDRTILYQAIEIKLNFLAIFVPLMLRKWT